MRATPRSRSACSRCAWPARHRPPPSPAVRWTAPPMTTAAPLPAERRLHLPGAGRRCHRHGRADVGQTRRSPSRSPCTGDQRDGRHLPTLASAGHYRIDAGDRRRGAVTDPRRPGRRWRAPSHAKRQGRSTSRRSRPDARRDMLQRVDAANMVAVPTATRDVIDVSSRLDDRRPDRGPDEEASRSRWSSAATPDFASRSTWARRWPGSSRKGHGVVTAGQTHWSQDCGVALRLGGRRGHRLGQELGRCTATAPLIDVRPDRGGAIQASTDPEALHHRRAKDRSQVIGPRPGEVLPRTSAPTCWPTSQARPRSRQLLPTASARRSSPSARSTPPATVDLGYRPWSSAIAGGGFDPAVSPGGICWPASLLWAANRIPPPTRTSRTEAAQPGELCPGALPGRPPPTPIPTSWACATATGMGSGAWHWAMANMSEFFGMSKGRHTVSVYAVDSAGNREPHTARYTFTIRGNPGWRRRGGVRPLVVYHRPR